ncbi:MaoC family dehydratase N-terminal domain-containing protein [Chloroflexota bacterium]
MLPEEVTRLIGKRGSVMILEVEKGAIKKFADAVDDQNPLYWDEEHARNSRHGAIIAPPGFFGWPTRWPKGSTFPLHTGITAEARDAASEAGYSRGLDGGMEYEFFTPVRAGDTLAASSMIKDIVEREGKTGKMVFLFTETTYTNQNGDLVARATHTSINR